MIQIKDKKDCCGCNACGDICAKKAITFPSDNEGFWYPLVDTDKCTNCGMCEKVCPMLHLDQAKNHGQKEPRIFGGFHKNITIRFDSTSGGAFSALANAFYKQGGYVAGAVFNEDWSVSNFISNNKKDLSRLRSSKYVESNAEGLYQEIKRLLIAGEKVLACGSPCQMAALRTYLGKDYDNLIIVDFLCRATNSPKAYRKYLDMLEEQYGGKIVYIKAKNKDHGWRSLARKVVFDNGKVYYGEGHDDHYRRGYHGNYFERPSCYDCKFKGLPRISDLTLGDFWGIDRVDPSLDKNLGTSMVMANTDKGQQLLDSIKSKMELKEFALKDVLPGNPDAIMGGNISYPAIDREQMFADMDTMRFDQVAEKYFPMEKPHGLSGKQKLKKAIKFAIRSIMHPQYTWRQFRWNEMCKMCNGKFLSGHYLQVNPDCALDIDPTAKIEVSKGHVNFGWKKNRKSHEESQLLLEAGATLKLEGENYFRPGTDIQVFRGATLRFGHGGNNVGLNIICADNIWIGDHTRMGRNVSLRDNNGGHSVIQTGYTDRAPIHIGNYVWIGSNVQIMKGVTIGDGAVVAANSVVTSNVPAHSMVSGNPAQVVSDNIVWVK